MKCITKHKIKIDKTARDAAHKVAWQKCRHNEEDYEKHYIGCLGEMVAAAYLGISWTDPKKSQRDLVDRYGVKYQVKTTREAREKQRHWCEKKGNWDNRFDRYIFVALDEQDEFGDIECDTIKIIAHENSHETDYRPALYRKSR